ncbi:MAG: DNA polymerase III subunit gamma/tau, partial [Victivallales bacterium]|nr:DNA polymerase III subunit gamma/tau [Victivallales bacterium]
MAYEVLARKWRPQKFADVVGQEQITKTLQSELLQSKLAHAYLFVGSRGIGKTTIARIFAKAMNCERAPIAEPCCECDSCKSIAAGNCIDLIEIDGASNNSVDNIRNICEEVLYAPINARYKVYIIDEVHMLSASAWNALLKTIEEPPAHAKFMFATTEAHKVLPTVVSRCQRFDLRRITFTSISDQLKKIAAAEGISISDAAIEVIARAADGGMRDAQSLLDQMIAFSSSDQGEITEEQTLSVFGLTGVAEMEHLLTSILLDDRPGLITSIHKIASHGKNLEKLFEDILAFLRGIHICMLMPDPETVLETGVDMIATYKKVGAITNTKVVHKMLEQLSPVGRMLHDALNKQIFIEMILLKSMRVAHSVEIEDLLARLNQIRGNGELEVLESMPPTAPKQEERKPVATAVPTTETPQPTPQPAVQTSVPKTPAPAAPIPP